MSLTGWSAGAMLLATFVYWIAVVFGWIFLQRRRNGPVESLPATGQHGTQLHTQFEESINLVAVAGVLLGPPIVLLLIRIMLTVTDPGISIEYYVD